MSIATLTNQKNIPLCDFDIPCQHVKQTEKGLSSLQLYMEPSTEKTKFLAKANNMAKIYELHFTKRQLKQALALGEGIEEAIMNLNYILHFPRDRPYISLLTEMADETMYEERCRIRRDINNDLVIKAEVSSILEAPLPEFIGSSVVVVPSKVLSSKVKSAYNRYEDDEENDDDDDDEDSENDDGSEDDQDDDDEEGDEEDSNDNDDDVDEEDDDDDDGEEDDDEEDDEEDDEDDSDDEEDDEDDDKEDDEDDDEEDDEEDDEDDGEDGSEQDFSESDGEESGSDDDDNAPISKRARKNRSG